MKKLLIAIAICLLLVPSVGWGTIPAATVWEIRTGGSNNNGCGWSDLVPGTSVDYTQQEAAQLALTDLAATEAASGVTLTSATGGFTDAMRGSLIHIISGTNLNTGTDKWYQITGYTNTNTVTIDRDCTDADGGDMSSGSGKVGGACKIADTLDDDMFSAVTAGNTIYIADGDYAAGEAISATAGADAAQIKLYGYKTTRANALDGTTTGTYRPSITVTTGAEVGFAVATGYWDVRNMVFAGDVSSASGLVDLQYNSYVYNSKFTNTTETANLPALQLANYGMVNYSEFVSGAGSGLKVATASLVTNSYMHDSKLCVEISGSGISISGNIIETCSTAGIRLLVSSREDNYIVGNTLYGAGSGIGISAAVGVDRLYVMNNIIANWTTGISHAATQLVENHNLFYSNNADDDINTAACIAGTTCGVNSFVSAGSPFVEADPAANPDFRVNSYAKALGFPNGVTLPGTDADGKGYTDIGALQRQEPTMASAW